MDFRAGSSRAIQASRSSPCRHRLCPSFHRLHPTRLPGSRHHKGRARLPRESNKRPRPHRRSRLSLPLRRGARSRSRLELAVSASRPRRCDNGFTLVDDKGNVLQAVGFNQQFRQNGNVLKMEYVLTFQLQKGNEAAKLVYSTSKATTIDIPFTLKDVTIP